MSDDNSDKAMLAEAWDALAHASADLLETHNALQRVRVGNPDGEKAYQGALRAAKAAGRLCAWLNKGGAQ